MSQVFRSRVRKSLLFGFRQTLQEQQPLRASLGIIALGLSDCGLVIPRTQGLLTVYDPGLPPNSATNPPCPESGTRRVSAGAMDFTVLVPPVGCLLPPTV